MATAILLVLAGCAGERTSPPSGSGPPSTTAGEDVRVIGTTDEIARIADLVGDPDGTIWVLNTVEPFFVAVASDGSVIETRGTAGGGPDEFRDPTTLFRDPETGAVWAFDAGHHALMRVDGATDGPIETITLPRDEVPANRVASFDNLGTGGRAWIRLLPSAWLIAVQGQGSTEPLRVWDTKLVELERSGDAVIRTIELGRLLGDPASRYGEAATEFLPFPLLARCPDASLALYDPVGNAIVRLSPDGVPTDTVALPPERNLELTFERVFRMAYGFMRERAPGGLAPDSAVMRAMLEAEWDDARAVAAGVFPEYADLQCPGDGSLWIQPFDPDAGRMGRGPEWLVLATDGSTSRFRFPDSFRPLRFDAAGILGISVGDYDVESAAWMALPGG